MTINLLKHFQEKLENRPWLENCLEGKVESFPYSLDEAAVPELSKPFFPTDPMTQVVTPRKNGAPLFVANIPFGQAPTKVQDYTKYSQILEQFKKEAFGKTPEQSRREILKSLSLALGINRVKSIDPAFNRAFQRYIRNLPKINAISARAFGFFLEPKWTYKKYNRLTYPKNKAFLLLKEASGTVKIPFQKIREAIKNSGSTRDFVKSFEESAPKSPIYYTIMDDDSISLRGSQTKEGVFSRLKTLIEATHLPSIISPGYRLKNDELPLVRFAVQIDAAVRATMPMPYFPEPCTAFKIKGPNEPNYLGKLSFIGKGTALESRRFIESGRNVLTDGAVFVADGAVVTTTPARMITEKSKKFATLTPAQTKTKPCLQSLRSRVIQSHAFPKQWADILYAGLNFSTPKVTDATCRMMNIFSVFDPISRMFASEGRFSADTFDSAMQNYTNPLTQTQKDILASAKAHLMQLKMKEEMVDLVIETAKKSGAAIYLELTKLVSD
ncbi:MAG: hypothetical protein COT85_01885 [Chlamydiae bacterium CG10_big_fil_rev_8_21_14_0_10_42_34]|nr:MAG: hypothetical protein COT85_01885 [Chlamydiae bacterium CG10_big_fil_rev_8_21_14_0_10_42_34]